MFGAVLEHPGNMADQVCPCFQTHCETRPDTVGDLDESLFGVQLPNGASDAFPALAHHGRMAPGNNEKGRWAIGGVAFGIAMKILPVLLLPCWLVKAKWKPVLWTVAFVGAWMMVPGLIWGWEHVLEWNLSWWNVIHPSQSQFVVNVESNAQTIAGIMSALSQKHVGLLAEDSVGIASQALRLAVLSAVLFRLWQNRRNFNDEHGSRAWVREVGMICIMLSFLIGRNTLSCLPCHRVSGRFAVREGLERAKSINRQLALGRLCGVGIDDVFPFARVGCHWP